MPDWEAIGVASLFHDALSSRSMCVAKSPSAAAAPLTADFIWDKGAKSTLYPIVTAALDEARASSGGV